MPVETIVIDNFDSFTFNLVQYIQEVGRELGEGGGEVTVFRNDAITVDEIKKLEPKRILISPGPGHPVTDSGVSMAVIKEFAGKIPILGVCLGLQATFELYGGTVAYTGEIKHGKTSLMKHDGKGVFEGIPSPFNAIRYHSLAGKRETLPDCLEITCETVLPVEGGKDTDTVIQGVRHKQFVLEGVQFHPESILTEHGKEMIRNWLKMKGGEWEPGKPGVCRKE